MSRLPDVSGAELVNALRRPQFLAPLVVFPTLFLAINVGGLGATRSLQGFPQVDGFLDFQLSAAIVQSLLIGGVGTGIAVALDIEGGFFDRLVASPTRAEWPRRTTSSSTTTCIAMRSSSLTLTATSTCTSSRVTSWTPSRREKRSRWRGTRPMR